ncbi:hypothetical protein J5226_12890 [Lysobacter sp. K5869]|uniref:hypothetical protein n=1 Tax=Lysobacter sp. K5869 TaxID=2820808 RepID=UPI001C05F455|nr:hypothetical protein [Lysobacter sp. K5869]QWP79221.1 hypothetical protein J5226_12890 [Lysobacter sp. K5869]
MANLLDSGADWTPSGVWNDGQGKFEFWLPPEEPVITVTYPGPTPVGGTLDLRYEWSFGSFRPPVEVIVNGAVIRTIDADGEYHLDASDIPAGSTLALRATRAEPEGELTANGCRIFRIEAPVMFVMQVAVEIEGGCEEFGRVTRAYVSAYDRARVHRFRLFPNERRCLVANFNGALPKGVQIDKAEWRMDWVQSLAMSDASIEGREARVMIQACYVGHVAIRCSVTVGGEIYTQVFVGEVLGGPTFGDAALAAGPGVLTIEA